MNLYDLANKLEVSSREDLKAFSRDILLEDGIDIDLVNLKEDGISIKSFSKLVKKVYELGLKEGLEQNALARGKKKRMEQEGKMLTKFRRTANYIKEHSMANKFIR